MFRYGLKFLLIFAFVLSGVSGQDVPGPVQPIPFSHKTHVGSVKLVCADCHVEPAKFGDPVSIPDADRCLECHAYSTEPTPTLAQLNAFTEKKQPIPWVRVFRLKDFVFFDHRYHLMNGAQCEECHGPIGTEDVVADRLKTTSMSFCQPCHVKTRALTGCNTCHDPR
jgi:predicted CXXCH cytochrome family protein